MLRLHSTNSELRFCAGPNPAPGVSEIRNDEDLWQWSRLEVRLKAFRRSTIPQKPFIIIIIIIIVKHVAPTFMKPNQTEYPFPVIILTFSRDVFEFTQKSKYEKHRQDPIFLSGNFSSCVTCNLIVHIVSNTTKNRVSRNVKKRDCFLRGVVVLEIQFPNLYFASHWKIRLEVC